MTAINKVASKYGYDFCEDSTSVLTIKVKNTQTELVHALTEFGKGTNSSLQVPNDESNNDSSNNDGTINGESNNNSSNNEIPKTGDIAVGGLFASLLASIAGLKFLNRRKRD